ncbi:TPA: restriction endonuclease subunit S [Acinetobacter baumannii]|nr:restriction endonuclease subunit S [Acinetobacter baumannii]HDI2492028.1 restriction endonuclease subunit S [Acinetobacter baumannii]HDI2512162.1 restriction endonuclease subunit S [Acinetobacter baumannii]HDI2809691.1 restriction endonuclease subunit S [Acinetobacter baumannii]HDI2812409.1 restriction endonuclease subunit S [Acinetobacter baumannii]
MAAPKLRFKEFDGDWTFKNLSDVSSKPLYGMNSAATDFDGENKYLRITDIDEESHRFKFTKLSSPSDVIEEKYILQEGDLLFARTGASVGKSYIYDPDDGKVVFAGFLIKFGLKESVIPYFIFTQTLSEKFNNWVITNSMRSGQPGINAEEYSKWQIAFTSKPEQIKIASFLSAVDEKISQLTQKHQLLSQYKQGMMQKLFSQQIRFKADDGSEFGEWKKRKVSDLFIEIKEKVLNQNIETYSITAGKGFVSQAEKFGRNISGMQNSNYIVLQPNDFSYNKGNSKTFKYGCVYLNEFDHPIAVPNVFISFRAKVTKSIYEKFYAHLFENHYLDRRLRLLISSSARMDGLLNVSKEGFFEIKLPSPCLEEQTKIANFLSAIDQKIEIVAQQIEQAKQWKKGLLQQMFV